MEGDEDSAGLFVTSDVVCCSCVVGPILSAVEDDVELLNEVTTVLFVSIAVSVSCVVISADDVTSVEAICSAFSVVGR